jgi:hypothetical protein
MDSSQLGQVSQILHRLKSVGQPTQPDAASGLPRLIEDALASHLTLGLHGLRCAKGSRVPECQRYHLLQTRAELLAAVALLEEWVVLR